MKKKKQTTPSKDESGSMEGQDDMKPGKGHKAAKGAKGKACEEQMVKPKAKKGGKEQTVEPAAKKSGKAAEKQVAKQMKGGKRKAEQEKVKEDSDAENAEEEEEEDAIYDDDYTECENPDEYDKAADDETSPPAKKARCSKSSQKLDVVATPKKKATAKATPEKGSKKNKKDEKDDEEQPKKNPLNSYLGKAWIQYAKEQRELLKGKMPYKEMMKEIATRLA